MMRSIELAIEVLTNPDSRVGEKELAKAIIRDASAYNSHPLVCAMPEWRGNAKPLWMNQKYKHIDQESDEQ